MKKIIWIIGTVLLVGISLGYLRMNKKSTSIFPSASVDTKNTIVFYSLEEIGQHASKDSCWLLIDGVVYDVTSYIESGFHPGKEAILMGCGKDATDLFNNRPNGSGKHSERAKSLLREYRIGEIKD